MNNKHDVSSLKRFFKYSLNDRRIIVVWVANSYLYYLLPEIYDYALILLLSSKL